MTNWDEILASPLSQGLKSDIKTFYKELVHDNMGENHETYDFTEIGKIAVLERIDDIYHLPEIGFYSRTMFLVNKMLESVDDVWIEGILYYRVIVLVNDAEGVVLYIESGGSWQGSGRMDKTREGGHGMQWFVVGFAVTLGVLTMSDELVTAM